jgi:Rubrerythrin
MPSTQENLKDAFTGESQVFQKYTVFAEKAEQERPKNIARLFHTKAQTEHLHARGRLQDHKILKPTLSSLCYK